MTTPVSTSFKAIYERNKKAFIPVISPIDFSKAVNKLRQFFLEKNFVEVHTQNRLSIMAACEDPNTIAMYNYAHMEWPLPQTGQMWLEHELLNNPNLPGVFCVSTSYRNEPNPIEGRHDRIFPMFEFELPGDIKALIQLEEELLEYLGFGKKQNFKYGTYESVCEKYKLNTISADDEFKIQKDEGAVFFLTDFPERTHPFWNMKRHANKPGIAEKVDVLLHGVETIGSAERSCDPVQQRQSFYAIEGGKYAEKLFSLFGKERVEEELEDFLSHRFFVRSGGGIGMTRMIRALKLSGLL